MVINKTSEILLLVLQTSETNAVKALLIRLLTHEEN